MAEWYSIVYMDHIFFIHSSVNGHLGCLHVLAFVNNAEWYSIVYMDHIFFIHSSVNGHLGCLHVLAFVNNAAVNIGVHVPEKRISLNITPV